MLDVTRLISRAGRVLTGVDRVELAYLSHLSDDPTPFFAIARTSLGYVLLDRTGARALLSRVSGQTPWGAADLTSRLARKASAMTRRAESDLRRLALGRCTRHRLPGLLRRHVPPGAAYLNTGHSNLTGAMLTRVKLGTGGPVWVFIHDTIPLDFPQFQRPGTPEKFRTLLEQVSRHADGVIYNSDVTRRDAERWMGGVGRVPPGVVAHLGVEPATPRPDQIPAKIHLERPYFMAIGTIEPRKNHALLLDVWQDLAADLTPDQMPGLLICGQRGWNNEAVFSRLKQLPPDGPVTELNGLSDGALSALLSGARALLQPSIVEGFGLPPVEAAALGVTVVAPDLPIYREVLGDRPVYPGHTDKYYWSTTIKDLLTGERDGYTTTDKGDFEPPSWDSHFNIVLRYT